MQNPRLPRLYPILDTESLLKYGIAAEAAAAAFLEGGARILQIRHKPHWGREAFRTAGIVARLCRDASVPLIINDRADFALLFHAGLHVGQDDLAPADARALLGPKPLIGLSGHDAQHLAAAEKEPVDYVAVGPIFATASKRDPDPVVGLEGVRVCRGATTKPLVAIGGINVSNAVSVLEAGADSVSVIAGLIPPAPNARSLRQRMEEWQQLLKAV